MCVYVYNRSVFDPPAVAVTHGERVLPPLLQHLTIGLEGTGDCVCVCVYVKGE